jgi:hypothetical protein
MSKITTKKLRLLNVVAAGLHAAQGVLVLWLSKSFELPISASYLAFNPATQQLEPATTTLFSVPLPLLVASFFFMSALAHTSIATIYFKWYGLGLARGINKARWIEYAVSASTMMVAISLLVGVYDAASLIMLFALSAIMNLMGLVMEVHNQTTKKTSWLSYMIGCLAGIVPWIVIALYMWAGAANGSSAPSFVYWIFVSLFIFFNCFALNMLLQYKKIGPWRDYIYGERVYIVLSLVAKSLLAWQVFAGTLRP